VSSLPAALRIAALINPFTYAVDLLKHALLVPLGGTVSSDLGIAVSVAVTAGFSVLAVALASWRFSREQAYEPLIHVLAGKR
jgi:ABC-2 type transport system permease protein